MKEAAGDPPPSALPPPPGLAWRPLGSGAFFDMRAARARSRAVFEMCCFLFPDVDFLLAIAGVCTLEEQECWGEGSATFDWYSLLRVKPKVDAAESIGAKAMG